MPVTREQVENALAMALDDEAAEETDITRNELEDIKIRFGQLITVLKNEATEDDADEP
jgi:Asp-tRNA(Asn)/Glu-tRNA(Gln) amidotransferase C subunit